MGVFIRGFDFGTTEEALKAHCCHVGEIVKFERQSNNGAVLTYCSAEEAEKAVSSLNRTVIEGNHRYIDVKLDEGASTGRLAAKDKGPKQPTGPDLPRQRISDAPVAGTVIHFKGNAGWLTLAEKVDHPEAAKHGGKIYVHKKDLQ